jgi:hypothetical protein
MPDCVFTAQLGPSSKNPQKAGDQFTVAISPPLKPGCRFSIAIDGHAVQPGDRAGDFKLAGLGGSGTATLESLTNGPKGLISFTVQCETCGPTTQSVAIPAPAPVTVAQPLAPSVPFTIPDDGKWVKLLDDGEPACKRIVVSNSGDTSIDVEVTYKDEQKSGTHPAFHVPPHSSILIECHVGELRVRGPAGSQGTWDTPSDTALIVVHGSGPAYHHGPSINEVLGFVCKTFRITNVGKKTIKAKYTRLAGPTDEKKEEDVAPGNTLVIRCKIVSIYIEGPPDAETQVKEVE